ncbi:MAG TPA: hypothetical protein VH088_05880 [Terriglobales bacterium]|nr:hypothetical protein [Terriglobales bacterium]
MAQSPPAGSQPPKLHGQTLGDKPIILPDASAGKVTLLVVSISRRAGERTAPWRERFAADFASDPHVAYYVVALLEDAPSFIRNMIRSAIRKSTPAAQQSHVLTSATGEAAWRKYLDSKDDTQPIVLLLDQTGGLRWSYNGALDSDHYASLKDATSATLIR